VHTNSTYNDSLHSKIEAHAGATVIAGPPAGSTTALSVQADHGASISHATTDPTITWDANVIVAAGASPYLLVDSGGNIVKAVNVTVDDSAGGGSSHLTSGQIKSSTVVVNTVTNPGSKVVFSASGGVTNSANNPYPLFTFTDTVAGITIINNSAKALQIGNLDVVNRQSTSAPEVIFNNGSSSGDFQFDIPHAVAPSLIDIEENPGSTPEDINLTGDIENPIGSTVIKDANGNVNNTGGSAQVIRTNTLDVEASASVGSSTNLIDAELIQSTDTSTTIATVIQASGPLSGQVISRGRLVSQVQVHGISGVVAAQGDIGVAVGSARLGGINSSSDVTGQIVTLGNIAGDLVIHGGLRGGRIAAKGSILGNVTVSGIIDAAAALVSGGSIGSAAAGTGLSVGTASVPGAIKGIVAAEGAINLLAGTISPTAFFQGNLGAGNPSKAAIDAIFTNNGQPLAFDLTAGGLDLGGLQLMLADLAALYVNSNGNLAGTKP
jgi:hypothetical protein